MRVLHLDSGREMRGGQWQVLSLVEGFGEGHTLLTPANGPLMTIAKQRGLDVQPMSMLSIANTGKRADLVHAHDARSHTWAASLTCSPLIVSRRVAFPVKRSILSRWKYGKPERFVAVSEHVRRALLEADVPEQKISVVYDGVEVPERSSDGERIIALKTGDPMKGTDLLDRACEIGHFQVHYSTNVPEDLRNASLFVYITRSEGLGSAALLAMAAGVPVVASRVGGLPEIVQDGVTGVLTDNTPEDIAEAMHLAISKRGEMGRNARAAVEQRFSVKQMLDGTREVYRQVLGC